jgi:putative Ca2+/H+ antiporter (TMEM165/GDT1 family)
MEALIHSFLLVALSEMGDKTQFLAFSFAARFKKPWTIMAGIFVATVLNHALASTLGRWIGDHISGPFLKTLLGLIFIVFGFWTLRPDPLDTKGVVTQSGAFWTTVTVFFLAEMGDKTQLATMALAARYSPVSDVIAGTTLGVLLSDGLAVFAGEKLTEKVSMKKIRWAAAGFFFFLGMLSWVSVWTGIDL